MARLSYSTSVDDLEIMAGALNTKGNVLRDLSAAKFPEELQTLAKAVFYYGAAAGIDQLLKLGKPDDAPYRVSWDCNHLIERLTDGD